MRQRRCVKALRNEGLSAAVSDRALRRRLPMLGSSAQLGISPQRASTYSLPFSAWRTTGTAWVGATLYRTGTVGTSGTWKTSATFFGLVSVNRPHMPAPFLLPAPAYRVPGGV